MIGLVIQHVALEGYKYIRRPGNIVCVFCVKWTSILGLAIILMAHTINTKDVLKTARRKIVQKGRKINFVTEHDPTFPDIRKAIGASEHILRAEEECNQVFPRGCFRVAYKRTHKNIKEMVAPSGIAIQEGSSNKQNSTSRNTHIKCSKCGRCGTATRGKQRAIDLYNCSVMLEGDRFRSTSTGSV